MTESGPTACRHQQTARRATRTSPDSFTAQTCAEGVRVPVRRTVHHTDIALVCASRTTLNPELAVEIESIAASLLLK
jgi:hypothetical protein